MKKFFTLCLSAASLATIGQANSSFSISGLNSDNEGVFAHSHYPNTLGHVIPAPYDAFGNDTAYYYLSSSDYSNYNASSVAGMHGTGTVTGFTQLSNALNFYGRTASEIKVQFDGASLGLDRQGEEWDLKGDTETRIYAGGTFAILLNTDTILKGKMPALDMTIDYNSELTPFDDQISAESHFVVPSVVISGDAETDSIAKAFYNDCKDYGLQFEFSSIQPAGQTEERDYDLVGAFFEIPSGNLRTGDVLIPNFGGTIEACSGTEETLDAGTFDSYLWSDQSTNQTVIVGSTGTYDVTVKKTGIQYTSEPVEVVFDICTSVSKTTGESFKIFPNPVTNLLIVQGEIGSFEIYNVLGKVVVQQEIGSNTIDISQLKSGTYFLKAQSGEVSRFVKK